MMRVGSCLLVVGCALFGVGLGCGAPPVDPKEPQTAAARARAEAKASGDDGGGKQWGGWRYQGERDDCFFVIGRRCFKTEEAACKAARCGAKKCVVDGGGPASVRCAK
jgi:hypothetical protein